MATVDPAEVAADLAALRSGVAVAAETGRSLLVVTGADRASFLQGMLTNEVAKLAPGQGCRALLLDEQGHVVAEMGVLVRPQEILLDVARSLAERVRAALDRFVVADDVEFAESVSLPVIVRGPGAPRALAASGGASDGPDEATLAALAPGAHAALSGAGPIAVREAVGGFLAWAPDAGSAAGLLGALRDAGAREVSPAALEVDRVARGLPREGVDLDEKTLAPEVPAFAAAISFRKGCYLGQEIVERVAARGKVNWLVTGLRAAAGPGLPEPGAVVTQDGREVGRVSSVVRLPGVEGIAMLARIRREAAESGAGLRVSAGGEEIEVVRAGRE